VHSLSPCCCLFLADRPFARCFSIRYFRLRVRSDWGPNVTKLSTLEYKEEELKYELAALRKEMKPLQKLEVQLVLADTKYKELILNVGNKIKALEDRIEQHKKRRQSAPIGARWEFDTLGVVHRNVLAYLKSLGSDIEQLDGYSLYRKTDVKMLQSLWKAMHAGRYACNSNCPSKVKDQRPGYENALIGASNISKITLVANFEAALHLTTSEE
jgi:hypothetical protein